MKKYLLISHFNYSDKDPIHGPIHNVAGYLKGKGDRYKLIELPLYSGAKSYEEIFDGKKMTRSSFGSIIKLPLPLKSLIEILQTLYKTQFEKYDSSIAADPLNAFCAILLKKIGVVRRVIYFTVDYAEERFSNKIFNSAYHFLDKYCYTNSDQVWNVSSRIYDKRIKQGVSKNKNYYIPNSPKFNPDIVQPDKKVNRFEVVMVSGLTHTPVFDMVLHAIKFLSKRYPKLSLSVIGSGPSETSLRNKIIKLKLKDRIKLLGQMNHGDLMNRISNCGVGLAIYTNDFNWTYFGDSMKARDYLAAGVPVIISDVVSTAEDVRRYNAGLVINPNEKDLLKALEIILKSKKNWKEKRKNGLKLAREYDFGKILQKSI